MNSRRLMCGWPPWQEKMSRAAQKSSLERDLARRALMLGRGGGQQTPSRCILALPTHRRFASGLWNRINENPARALVQLKGRGLGNAHQLEAKKDRALRPEKHLGAREVPKSVSRTHCPLSSLADGPSTPFARQVAAQARATSWNAILT
jgi:hypothetical protein